MRRADFGIGVAGAGLSGDPMGKAGAAADDGEDRRPRVVTPTRVAVYLHLAAVGVTAAIAWLDRTARLPPEGLVGLMLGVLMWASFLALIACPVIVIVAFARRPSWRSADACIVEVGLVVVQFLALLPLVS